MNKVDRVTDEKGHTLALELHDGDCRVGLKCTSDECGEVIVFDEDCPKCRFAGAPTSQGSKLVSSEHTPSSETMNIIDEWVERIANGSLTIAEVIRLLPSLGEEKQQAIEEWAEAEVANCDCDQLQLMLLGDVWHREFHGEGK